MKVEDSKEAHQTEAQVVRPSWHMARSWLAGLLMASSWLGRRLGDLELLWDHPGSQALQQPLQEHFWSTFGALLEPFWCYWRSFRAPLEPCRCSFRALCCVQSELLQTKPLETCLGSSPPRPLLPPPFFPLPLMPSPLVCLFLLTSNWGHIHVIFDTSTGIKMLIPVLVSNITCMYLGVILEHVVV